MSELSKLVEQLNQPDQPFVGASPEVKQTIDNARLEESKYELQNDKQTYRVALCILGVLSIGGSVRYYWTDVAELPKFTQIPDGIVAIGSGEAGAIDGR